MKFGQVSIRETSASKPSLTRRKALEAVKTRGARILWDKSVGYLSRDNQDENAYCLIRRCSQTWMPLPH